MDPRGLRLEHYQGSGIGVRDIGGAVFQNCLFVQNKPGLPVEQVRVSEQLPEGVKLNRASPAPTVQVDGWVRIVVDMTGDGALVVEFSTG